MGDLLALAADPNVWASLLTLTALEIVLGVDNLVFLSIITQRLPKREAKLARRIGLLLAMVGRIALLLSITWIMGLTAPLFDLAGETYSWRDLVLFAGGFFLLYKGTMEIHGTVEGEHEEPTRAGKSAALAVVVVQIFLLDLIFSLDSVLTAVGMAQHLPVMIAAIVIAIGVMLLAAEPLSAFVGAHPTVKMLALSFILLIGVALVADALHFHIPRGYIYMAIAFSVTVEALNLWALARRRRRLAARKAAR